MDTAGQEDAVAIDGYFNTLIRYQFRQGGLQSFIVDGHPDLHLMHDFAIRPHEEHIGRTDLLRDHENLVGVGRFEMNIRHRLIADNDVANGGRQVNDMRFVDGDFENRR